MHKEVKLAKKVVSALFFYRYVICLSVVFFIIFFGLYLYYILGWKFKDMVQVCSSFFIVLTLFFAVLNYEFAANKTKTDTKSAKEILTYNIAAEWHKSPVKDYQKSSIEFEKKFLKTNTDKTIDAFLEFIEREENLEFKESLKGILNYFETLSIAAYKGVIDTEFIKEFHNSIFRIYYVDYKSFIDKRREMQNNDAIWENYTKLAEDWNPGLKEKVSTRGLKSTVIS